MVRNVGIVCELFRNICKSHNDSNSSVCCCSLWIGTTLNYLQDFVIESKGLHRIFYNSYLNNGVIWIFYREKKPLSPYLFAE